MSTLMDMPAVDECSVAGCSYNDHSHCHAAAVTIGGRFRRRASARPSSRSACKGGLDKVVTHVGACQRAECTHNSSLECTAASMRIGAGHDEADCLTFTTA